MAKQTPTPDQLVVLINSLEERISKLAETDFPKETAILKGRLQKGETLDTLLPEAFALVREVAKRTLKERHFDVQLLGGIALHQGKIAEIETGEGKTLTATLPVYLNALTGKGVHVVTVNDYLARRDLEWMGPIYATLGLSSTTIVPDKSYIFGGGLVQSPFPVTMSRALKACTRREAYRADITYGMMSEFGFDYLRDNMVTDPLALVQRSEEEGGYHFALIDEVDSTLIDEARTPLIITAQTIEDTTLFTKFAKAVATLREDQDFEIDPELKAAYFTEEGLGKLEQSIGVDNLFDPDNETLAFHAQAALKARAIFTKDREYIVKNDEIIIVDEFTGRLMYGRRFTEGIHQAIEAKEGVPVKAENKTLASVSIQSYFKKYKKLAGMSGTILPAKREFEQVYGIGVEVVPTNKPMVRQDQVDRIFVSREGRERALIQLLEQKKMNLQPVLLGTRSIEENEHLSQVLTAAHIKHQVLNAKNHETEAASIAQAGRGGAVTLATNMAGRGVDILLGGNPPDFTDSTVVRAAGGLVVIGTERHESKRIDDQLRGRSGRQGDPGESVFLLSLEDELVRVFTPDDLETMRQRYASWPVDTFLPEEKELLELFDKAQQRVEARNEEIRIQLIKYDSFVSHQREAMYHMRKKLLGASDLARKIHADTYAWLTGVTTLVKRYRVSEGETIVDFGRALRVMRPLFVAVSDEEWLTRFQNVKTIRDFGTVAQKLILAVEGRSKEKNPPEILLGLQRDAYLKAIDDLWMEHMTELETIRAGIDFAVFAGKEPLDEFKIEADEKYRALQSRIPELAVENYLKSLV